MICPFAGIPSAHDRIPKTGQSLGLPVFRSSILVMEAEEMSGFVT